MKKKLPFLKTSIILLIVFAVITFLVRGNLFTRVDLLITFILQNYIPRVFDLPFSLFSLLGSFEIAILILLLLWVIYKKMNFIFILLSFGLFQLIEVIGKLFVNHPSPPQFLFRYDIPFSFPSSSFSTGSSYPSGHLGRTTFISVIIIFMILKSKKFSKNQKLVLSFSLCLLTAVMFISRIYLGEHWFSDVLGGSVLGASLGFLSIMFSI